MFSKNSYAIAGILKELSGILQILYFQIREMWIYFQYYKQMLQEHSNSI